MEHTISILKALSDANRLRILMALKHNRELCPCQITELLNLRGATVSKHLQVLQRAGLLKSRKNGRWIFFQLSIESTVSPLIDWLSERFMETDTYMSDREILQQILSVPAEDICRKQRGNNRHPIKEQA